MDNRTVLESRITSAMEQELLPVAGETMSLADVERALEDLGRQFDSLLKEASSPERQEEYTERFRAVSTSMAELKNRRELPPTSRSGMRARSINCWRRSQSYLRTESE